MADVSTTKALRGMVILDPRLTYSNSFSSANSSLTQAGPLPGVPEAQDQTDMVLEASGAQSASGQLRVRCLAAGMPGYGSFVWKGQADTLWRGWEPPNTISGHEILNLSTTASTWLYPHAITLANGKVLCVVQKLNTSHRVACWVRSATAGTWTETEVYDNSTTYTNGANPTVCQLPSGRIVCLFWIEVTATRNQIRMYYSDDDGATWTLGSQNVLSTPFSTATDVPGRLRAAALPDGSMSLVAQVDRASATYDDILFQYASTSSGAVFDLVDSTGWTGAGATTNSENVNLIAVGSRLMLAYLAQDGGVIQPRVRFIGSVGQLFSAQEEVRAVEGVTSDWGVAAGGNITDSDLAACCDESGVIYLIGRESGTRECFTVRSLDDGVTWAQTGSASTGDGTNWYNSADSAIYPLAWTATWQAGRIVLVHRFSTDAATTDPSLAVTYLGGYATVTLPFLTSEAKEENVVGWERTWLGAFSEPDDSPGWTEVSGVAATKSFTATGLRLQDSGGGTSDTYYQSTSATTHTQGYISLTQLKVTSGTGYVYMRTSDATPVSYEVRVAVTTTAITLRDMAAGADIGTAETTTAGTTGVQILIALGNAAGGLGNTGKVYAWWRATGGIADNDREWELIGSLGTSSTLTASAVATDAIRFGILAAASTDVTFAFHCYTYGAYTGLQLYGGQTNPTAMLGRTWPTRPAWVDDGVKIRAVDGPAFSGDDWNIDTRYEYGIANVFPEVVPSPRRPWRSTGVTQADIVLEFAPALDQETLMQGQTLAVYLGDINFAQFTVSGYDEGGATYDTLATVDTRTGHTALAYRRLGDQLSPSQAISGTADARWYTYHELEGSCIEYTDGGETTVIRKILWNSEGAWRKDDNTTKVTRLILEGVVSSDPAGGVGTSAAIRMKECCVLVPMTATYSRIRIRITAQNTYEGYFKIGTMAIGHVAYFAHNYSWNRILEVEPNYDIVTGRAGTRRVRRLGPPRRAMDFAWADVDVSAIAATQPTPDYITAYTGATEPVASPRDTPYLMHGIIAAMSGPVLPVVLLSRVARPANSSAVVITHRHHMLYGRIMSVGRLENVLGDEWENPGEVFDVATVRVEEEV